jgi:bla regulator protein blaR1
VNWIPALAYGVWATGFAVLVLTWWRRWQSLRAAVGMASPLDLAAGIQAMTSPAFSEPGVLGIWRPVLLLPAGITDRLTPAQLAAIVAHEVCHVRRRDNLTAAIHMGVEALFWFHPMVWWLGARLMEERERACDEEVLRRGAAPEAYAEGILKICEMWLESPLACVCGVTGGRLKRRIEGRVPAFEVASLKPDQVGCQNIARAGNFSPSPGRLEMPCVSLGSLIQTAYGTFGDGVSINTTPLHMEGGPSWMWSQFYSLSAKADGPVRTEMLAGPMLQTFLAERFRLKAHRETRQMPVYALMVGKGGLKVQPLAEGACTPIDLTHPPAPPKPGGPPPNLCGLMTIGLAGKGDMRMEVRGATMTQFAQRLSGRVDRTVTDKTSVTGQFNFHLEFTPDPQMPGQQLLPRLHGDTGNAGASTDPLPLANPGLFTALQEQLGLKLESEKGPVGVLVIDHVERPSGN